MSASMNRSNAFLEDIELTDKLFDELITELEFDNYTNNDFITFNNYNNSNADTNAIGNSPVQSSNTGTNKPNYVMFGSANQYQTNSNNNNSNTNYISNLPALPANGYSLSYDYADDYYDRDNPTQQSNSLHNEEDYSNIFNRYPDVPSANYFVPPTIQPTKKPTISTFRPTYNLPQPAGKQFLFSTDLNARISEEIFKDEENDLFLGQQQQQQQQQQYYLPHISDDGTYYPSNSSLQQYPQSQQSQQLHQQLRPVSNPASISTKSSFTFSDNTPHSPSDDEFVVGAVTLASSSPNQVHYTHQTVPISPSGIVPTSENKITTKTQNSPAMNVNLHKSSVKRKNKDISDEGGAGIPSIQNSMSPPSSNNSSKHGAANSLMSNTNVAAQSTSNGKPHPMYAKLTPLLDFPIILFQAFNGGDFAKVKDIIVENTTKDCSLRTPSLFEDVYGQNNVIEFFNAFSDDHPDAVWVAKKCKFVPENLSQPLPAGQYPEIHCRIYFAGTRIFKPQLMNQMFDLDHHHGDYLYRRKNSSLLDEMDTSAMSVQEKAAIKELETRGKNLSIFAKGTLQMRITEEKKIIGLKFHWVVNSFREAEL